VFFFYSTFSLDLNLIENNNNLKDIKKIRRFFKYLDKKPTQIGKIFMTTFASITHQQPGIYQGKTPTTTASQKPVFILKTQYAIPPEGIGFIAGSIAFLCLPVTGVARYFFATVVTLIGNHLPPIVFYTKEETFTPHPDTKMPEEVRDYVASFTQNQTTCQEIPPVTSFSKEPEIVNSIDTSPITLIPISSSNLSIPTSDQIASTSTKSSVPPKTTNKRYVQYGVVALVSIGSIAAVSSVGKTVFCATAELIGVSPSTLITTVTTASFISAGVLYYYNSRIKA
jgi:hypothetical protein